MKTRQSRSVIARLQFVAERIASGRGMTIGEIAGEWEVSYRTIHRDVEFLRDQLGHQLVFDTKANGWFYTEAPPAMISVKPRVHRQAIPDPSAGFVNRKIAAMSQLERKAL